MMSSVNTQIQRAISDAINGQIVPQIQSVLNAESGQSTLNKWNVSSERPGMNSQETYGEKAKKNNSEQRFDYQNGSHPNLRTYDTTNSDNFLFGTFKIFRHPPNLKTKQNVIWSFTTSTLKFHIKNR